MSTSGWMSEKQRKEARREAKLCQERAYAENVKLERMSRNDPRLESQTRKMVETAQECGRNYGRWLKAQGRNIKLKDCE